MSIESVADQLKRASLLQRQGGLTAAASILEEALELEPENFDVLHLLGVIQLQLNNNLDAERYLAKAVMFNPASPTAHYNLGLCLDRLTKKTGAIANYSKAIQLNPQDYRSLNNRAKSLRDIGKPELSLADCEAALRLQPDYAAAHNNRGAALRDLGRYEDALLSYDRSLALTADSAEALYNRGNILLELNRYRAAAEAYTRLLAVAPETNYIAGNIFSCHSMMSDWSSYENNASYLTQAIKNNLLVDNPFHLLAYSDSESEQLLCASNYSAIEFPPRSQALWSGEVYRHDKIRIAYVSADFREHPLSRLMVGLFETHDREHFECIAISLLPEQQTPIGQRIKAAFTQFIDVSRQNDLEVASLLRQMEIDVVVDLMGYTRNNRTGIFTYRPAPVQISYLGFPGTMGAPYIDYILADRFVIPEASQIHYAERIVYLPDTYYVTDNKLEIAATTMTRAEANLPDSGFVFCCFNSSYKITPFMFDIWMRLLQQVDGSVLWLLETNQDAKQNLRMEAQKRGVAAERLVFAARTGVENHLARHRLADLCLDTLPYNAHTTATDALWAGLPVLTSVGTTLVGRVAGSLLQALGLPELITHSLEEYEALALKLASTPGLLASIKVRLLLHRDTHALFDTDRFRRHIEAAYASMWQRYQQSLPPQSFKVEHDF